MVKSNVVAFFMSMSKLEANLYAHGWVHSMIVCLMP
jgi:hypothetical protein